MDRLELTLGDVGITVEGVSEKSSSRKCPQCESENVHRAGAMMRSDLRPDDDCELDAHSDVAGAWNVLQKEVE
ncbi:zinc ribbon domain-containing protein [Haloquadratum walsbyi]|uniref:zinc ribbon domain-containing protein n=1 Tax=Haloquadratum walsbyi TaxID=293091 RepID=UPI00373FC884